MNRNFLLAAAVLTLSACASSKPYACKLEDTHSCNNMQEVYDAARRAPRDSSAESVLSAGSTVQHGAVVTHNPNTYTEPGERGQPVFKQPRVYRVWLAPYVDADGNLRTGEYAYFSTPGEWGYGTTREPGSASGTTFGPRRPGELGFTPVDGNSDAAPPVPETRRGITQPVQTLTN